MPCRSDYDYTSPSYAKRPSLEEHDLVTRVACGLATSLEIMYNDLYGYREAVTPDVLLREGKIDKEIRDWIVAHRKADTERRIRLKESALAKLTEEEKKVLGLYDYE